MFTWIVFCLDLLLRIYFSYRILKRRLPVGVAWAWLCLVLIFPFGGTFLYLFLGEYRMGTRRLRRLNQASESLNALVRDRFARHSSYECLNESAQALAVSVKSLFDAPVLAGNEIELLRNADFAFPQMIRDIDAARISCDMEFYIWSDGGRADEFGEALLRACGRGVRVRILVDQVGSKGFLVGQMSERLRAAGAQVQAALPSGIVRSFFSRPDLRIHRKIMVIDGAIGFTGSLNLADPKMFHLSAGVGEWVDALCRVRGPAVEALGVVFLSDWSVEATESLQQLENSCEFVDSSAGGTAGVQCLASRPAIRDSNIEQALVTAIYGARRELILTTPYFVPSESLLYALMGAARRGVDVTLIVPAQVDSHLTQHASQAFLHELRVAGVYVALFGGGMLHTKSVTVDGEVSLFGSLNLDPRSLRINFEITLTVYDRRFTADLISLQRDYLRNSRMLGAHEFAAQSWVTHLKQDLARLVSPLL